MSTEENQAAENQAAAETQLLESADTTIASADNSTVYWRVEDMTGRFPRLGQKPLEISMEDDHFHIYDEEAETNVQSTPEEFTALLTERLNEGASIEVDHFQAAIYDGDDKVLKIEARSIEGLNTFLDIAGATVSVCSPALTAEQLITKIANELELSDMLAPFSVSYAHIKFESEVEAETNGAYEHQVFAHDNVFRVQSRTWVGGEGKNPAKVRKSVTTTDLVGVIGMIKAMVGAKATITIMENVPAMIAGDSPNSIMGVIAGVPRTWTDAKKFAVEMEKSLIAYFTEQVGDRKAELEVIEIAAQAAIERIDGMRGTLLRAPAPEPEASEIEEVAIAPKKADGPVGEALKAAAVKKAGQKGKSKPKK